jgi:hypothetical protein
VLRHFQTRRSAAVASGGVNYRLPAIHRQRQIRLSQNSGRRWAFAIATIQMVSSRMT